MGQSKPFPEMRFYFIVSGPDWAHDGPDGTALPNNDAAIAFARRIIRELRESGGYDDPALTLIVKDRSKKVVAVIPFNLEATDVTQSWTDGR